MENTANGSVTSYAGIVTARRAEDLILWVTVEPLCCVFEANIRLYVNDTLIKIRKRK